MSTARFNGKTILITGGNSGIGYATAKRIVSEGGRVIITGRDLKTLEQAQRELGSQSEAIRADVGKLQEIETLMSTIKQRYGKIDGVFANAGIAKFTTIEAVTEEDFDMLFAINVKGVFFTLQKVMPLLAEGSSVVLNASVTASKGSPTSAVYGATKAAVRNMARNFSAAYLERRIRFNVVSPGPIETPIWDRPHSFPAGHEDAVKLAVAAQNPLKRYGTTDEVTAAIAFLLSPESTYILGAELLVDGGVTQL